MMPTLTHPLDVFLLGLADIYDAEHHFLDGQRDLLANATNPQLQNGIRIHIEQTQQQIAVLNDVFAALGQSPRRHENVVAAALVQSAREEVGAVQPAPLRDMVVDNAAAKVEHVEIASYRGLIAQAQAMGQDQIVALLRRNLEQEEVTARLLEDLAPILVGPQVPGASVERSLAGSNAEPNSPLPGPTEHPNSAAIPSTSPAPAVEQHAGPVAPPRDETVGHPPDTALTEPPATKQRTNEIVIDPADREARP